LQDPYELGVVLCQGHGLSSGSTSSATWIRSVDALIVSWAARTVRGIVVSHRVAPSTLPVGLWWEYHSSPLSSAVLFGVSIVAAERTLYSVLVSVVVAVPSLVCRVGGRCCVGRIGCLCSVLARGRHPVVSLGSRVGHWILLGSLWSCHCLSDGNIVSLWHDDVDVLLGLPFVLLLVGVVLAHSLGFVPHDPTRVPFLPNQDHRA
jgi:hypothetical protein